MAGIVYCLTNPAMPDLVKIGMIETDDANALKSRLRALYTSGVPFPFELFCAVAVDDPKKSEQLLHEAFGNARKNPGREFFGIEPERVFAAMKLTGGSEVRIGDADDGDIRADIDAGNRERARVNQQLATFTFPDLGIQEGEELTFSRDDTIKVIVCGRRRVHFAGDEGEPMYLSGATRKAFEKIGDDAASWPAFRGPLYWEYKGEILSERRHRLASIISEEDE